MEPRYRSMDEKGWSMEPGIRSGFMDKTGIDDRTWEIYFSPGGKIETLQTSINKLYKRMDELCRKIDKYNGLHEKIDEVVAKVEMQEKRCSETLLAQSTEADVMKRINMAKERLFFKVVKLVAVIFAGLGFFLALAGRYWW
jgi:hypothetical protein